MPDKSGTALLLSRSPRAGHPDGNHLLQSAPRNLRFCCRKWMPFLRCRLDLLAQNAVALVAEPSPLIRKVNEWLQTVSVGTLYILLNTLNDGPVQADTRPNGEPRRLTACRACLETAENTGATVPFGARLTGLNQLSVILQTEIPSNTARLQRGSRDGPAPFIYKTAYNAEFAGSSKRRCQFSPQILPSGAKTDSRDPSL